jgi:hypothetical protein
MALSAAPGSVVVIRDAEWLVTAVEQVCEPEVEVIVAALQNGEA